jgi:predicted dehydrogenase
MRIAIIGCGLIGRKRAQALAASGKDTLVCVCDIDAERAGALAKDFNCEPFSDWRQVAARGDIDIIINSSINATLESINIASLSAGKHVLCEKPLGRNAAESARMIEAEKTSGRVLKTGFNHRFHPAIWQAKQLLDEGRIGEVFTIRAVYGHGGRPGMEGEWRSSKEMCGGGELLDQGVHVIDLVRWFGGEVHEVIGRVETKFWNIEVEDSAFAIMKLDNNATAQFHVTWTQWKNMFRFDIFGRDGYLAINGLGGSYGPETLEIGIRKKEGGRPDVETIEYPAVDESWLMEWKEFRSAIDEGRKPIGSGYDGHRANEVIGALYRANNECPAVRL